MHTKARQKVKELNEVYHGFATNTCVNHAADREKFKNYVKQLKKWGYQFICPTTNFADYELNAYESNHYSRIELLRKEVRFGVENNLGYYAMFMRIALRNCKQFIYHSLCKRGMLTQEYFQIQEDESNWIIFRQGATNLDDYVLYDDIK